MEMTLHIGGQDEIVRINVDWFDENNKHYSNKLEIQVLERDKPRTIAIVLDKLTLANIDSGGITRN